MDEEISDADWELMFPTRCSCCNGLLTWCLWDAVCQTCDLDRDPDNDQISHPLDRGLNADD